MTRKFVDPFHYSKRAERLQITVMAVLPVCLAGVFWIRWWFSKGEIPVTAPLIFTGLVAPAFGLGYYMVKRARVLIREQTWIEVDKEGIRSITPAGEVFVTWPEIREIEVGLRPSRNRMPDMRIKTGRGAITAFMRYVEWRPELPEPVLSAPGLRFTGEYGAYDLSAANSELVAALRERAGPGKMREGVLIST